MLQMKIFTLRFSDRLNAFNDEPVQEFVRDKEVVEVRDYFFERDGAPHLALLVIYRSRAQPESAQPAGKASRKGKEDWRKELSDEDWPLFNALREWRSERAKADGVPPYVIATNRQFVAIVKKRPDSLSHLSSVDGFGQAKLKRYGADIIRIAGTAPASAQSPDDPAEQTDQEHKADPEHAGSPDEARVDTHPSDPADSRSLPHGDEPQTS